MEKERLERNRSVRAAALAAVILAGAMLHGGSVGAQSASPVGVWRTIDDASGKPKALVRIMEQGGVLTGRIEKLFDPGRPDPVCEHCTDERKGQPIVGMTILKGLKAGEGGGAGWEGGEILDPNNGKTYRAKATLSEDGGRLEVRGFIGVALFGRTQTWIREE